MGGKNETLVTENQISFSFELLDTSLSLGLAGTADPTARNFRLSRELDPKSARSPVGQAVSPFTLRVWHPTLAVAGHLGQDGQCGAERKQEQ